MLSFKFNHKDNVFEIRPADIADAWKISYERNKGDWQYLKDPNLQTSHDTENWIRNLSKSSRRWVVERIDTTKKRNDGYDGFPITYLAGIVRIDDIDLIHHNCMVGLDIYEEAKGTGLSYPVYNIVLQYLFYELNMNAVYLEVLETNERAIHIYEKLGFKHTGRIPQRIFRHGKYIDYLHMSLLRKDFDVNRTSS